MGTSPLFYFIMVVFDELRIDNKGEYLYIGAHLRKDLQDAAVRIEEVWVCDSSHYEEGPIPSKAEKVYQYNKSAGDALWSVSLKVSPEGKYNDQGDLVNTYDNLPTTFAGKLLFVYVVVAGIDELTSPCGCASNPSIGVALDMGIIYKQFMNYMNELACSNKCNSRMPQGLTDFILRFNALLLAMDSKHYKKGIEFFNKWFSGKVNEIKSNCGCNG